MMIVWPRFEARSHGHSVKWTSDTGFETFLLADEIGPSRLFGSRGFFSGKGGGFSSFFGRSSSNASSTTSGMEASIHQGGVGGFRQVLLHLPTLMNFACSKFVWLILKLM